MPFIPITMGIGFITAFVGVVSPFISVLAGHVAYLFLHYELSVVDFLSDFPFSSFSIPNFPLWLTIIIYVYFICKIFGRDIKKFFTKEAS